MSYELFSGNNNFTNIFVGLNDAKTSTFKTNATSWSFEKHRCSSQGSLTPDVKKENCKSEEDSFWRDLLAAEDRAVQIQEEGMKKLEAEMMALCDMDDCKFDGKTPQGLNETETKKSSQIEHVAFPVFQCSPPPAFKKPPPPKPIEPFVSLTIFSQENSVPALQSEPKKILLELKKQRLTVPSTVPLNNVQTKNKKILLELKNPHPRRVFSSVYDI